MAAKPIDLDAFRSWVASFPRKFTDEDIHRQPRLFQAACAYAAQYNGNYEYMAQMHALVVLGGVVTVQQARGILNCAASAERRSARVIAGAERAAANGGIAAKAGVVVESREVHAQRFLDYVNGREQPQVSEMEAAALDAQAQAEYDAEMRNERILVHGRERLEMPECDYLPHHL